jgi:hypothetical protein
MVQNSSWETQINRELSQAEAARASGNEGKARVCARRAAGLAVEEYLTRQGVRLEPGSAYNYLRYLADLPDITPGMRLVAGHFLERVTTAHNLPMDADLIAEARWLVAQLLAD